LTCKFRAKIEQIHSSHKEVEEGFIREEHHEVGLNGHSEEKKQKDPKCISTVLKLLAQFECDPHSSQKVIVNSKPIQA
jgi:hypothetical protein